MKILFGLSPFYTSDNYSLIWVEDMNTWKCYFLFNYILFAEYLVFYLMLFVYFKINVFCVLCMCVCFFFFFCLRKGRILVKITHSQEFKYWLCGLGLVIKLSVLLSVSGDNYISRFMVLFWWSNMFIHKWCWV